MPTCWVAGGSGLVGRELLDALLADATFERVVSVGRRTLPLENPRLVQTVVDFGDPQTFATLPAAEIAFSCLGTTRKKAGSAEAFRAVDLDAVVAFARAAREKGATVFAHVTALGANAGSGQLYLRTKGEVEAAVAGLGFQSVTALRPSFLDGGDREREEGRPLERFTLAVGRAFAPVLGKYRPTSTVATARVLVERAKEAAPGAHVVDASDIR